MAPLVESGTREHANRELATVLERRVHGELKGRGDVMDRRDAELREMLLRGTGFPQPLIERLWRDRRAHARECRIRHATGCATAHALETADRPIARQPRGGERVSIGEPRAPVPPVEQDGRASADG